jgi:hypothetical protein
MRRTSTSFRANRSRIQAARAAYALLRHSLLLEYWNAAANLVQPDPAAFGAGWLLTREQELDAASGITPTFTQMMTSRSPV